MKSMRKKRRFFIKWIYLSDAIYNKKVGALFKILNYELKMMSITHLKFLILNFWIQSKGSCTSKRLRCCVVGFVR